MANIPYKLCFGYRKKKKNQEMRNMTYIAFQTKRQRRNLQMSKTFNLLALTISNGTVPVKLL